MPRADDPHLGLVLTLLAGIRQPERRVEWVQTCMPRTFAMLGISQNWSVLADIPPDGSGSMPRRAAEVRPEPDSAERFVAELVEVDRTKRTQAGPMLAAYKSFCRERGLHRLTNGRYGEVLSGLGVVTVRCGANGGRNWWVGLGLRGSPATATIVRECRFCGGPLTGKSYQRFCSGRHRDLWLRERVSGPLVCRVCARPLPYRARLFCSPECWWTAARARRRARTSKLAAVVSTIAAGSIEYLKVAVSALKDGAAVDFAADPVDFAFPRKHVDPQAGDWGSGDWEVDARTGETLARALVGHQPFVLGVGDYDVWVRITDSPEVPVLKVGLLQVT